MTGDDPPDREGDDAGPESDGPGRESETPGPVVPAEGDDREGVAQAAFARPDDGGGAPDTRRLHPLSIPYRAVTRAFSTSTVVLLAGIVGSGSVDLQSLSFVGLVLGALALGAGYQYVYYLRFEFTLTEETFDVTSGVLSRRDREIPLRRVQNVDVSQDPLQRALGIAALRIETAGGGDTEAVLECLGRAEADTLRDDLRRGARRARDRERGVESDDETAVQPAVEDRDDDADREEVFALSRRSLLVLSLFSFDAGAGAISTVAGAVLSGGDPSNLAGVQRVLSTVPLSPVETAVVGVSAVALLAWVLSVVFTFARYYGFRLVRVDEGLEYERGLLQRASGTIPVEKVQTVSLRESLPHRRLGYATVAVETAGYSPGSDRSARQLAVPLAPRSVAVAVARSVEEFEGDLELDRPPERARRRYTARFALAVLGLTGVAAVALALLATQGVGPGLGVDRRVLAVPLAALLLTPLAARLRWNNRGHRTGPEHFLARTGFWRRVTRVVPYYRVQTVVDSRTVFQRRRRLASVTADTASSASLLGGDAVAIDVDDATAETLRERLQTELDRSIRERTRRRKRRRATNGSDAGAEDTRDPTTDTAADTTAAGTGDTAEDTTPPDESASGDASADDRA